MIMPQKLVYTLGHSTRSIEEFVCLLKEYGIQKVVDVRTIPKSRHAPQFNKDSLGRELRSSGIDCVNMQELGGLRKAKSDSVNQGWENASFRGFADYMQTKEFDDGLKKLIEFSQEKKIAIVCAEAKPWECHRSLIADVLVARNVQVFHIMGTKNIMQHKITHFAKINGSEITYPG